MTAIVFVVVFCLYVGYMLANILCAYIDGDLAGRNVDECVMWSRFEDEHKQLTADQVCRT